MKHFTAGRIFCKCSARMNCTGKAVRIYESTTEHKSCPNCGRDCQVMIEPKKKGKK